MRKLNRVIAAGALAVPMALGASGIAVAAESGSELQNQVETAEGNGSGSEDDFLDLGGDNSDNSDNSDNLIEEILRSIFGEENGGGDSGSDSIFDVGDDEGSDQGNSGNDEGFLNGNNEGDSGSDSLGIL